MQLCIHNIYIYITKDNLCGRYNASCMVIWYRTANWCSLPCRMAPLPLPKFSQLSVVLCTGLKPFGHFCIQFGWFICVFLLQQPMLGIMLARLYGCGFYYYSDAQSYSRVPDPLTLKTFQLFLLQCFLRFRCRLVWGMYSLELGSSILHRD